MALGNSGKEILPEPGSDEGAHLRWQALNQEELHQDEVVLLATALGSFMKHGKEEKKYDNSTN